MQNFNEHVAALAIELYASYNVHKMAEAYFNGKATFNELTLAICKNACHFSIYRVSNLGNYSTRQLYEVLANAIMAATKERATSGYYAHRAIFKYTESLKVKPLLNVALYAVEAYFNYYKGVTPQELPALFESGKFTMLSKAVYLAQLKNVERFCKHNNVHNCPKCITCYLFEQCLALPTLKEVKQFLTETGLFNNYTPIS